MMEERFWAKVDRQGPAECWPWLAARNPDGYGDFWNGGTKSAHRVAYELSVGPIQDGLTLDHLCRNRACCNPGHLEPVTHRVNMERGIHATKTECAAGHPFDEANTYRWHRKRICRACNREAQRRARKP